MSQFTCATCRYFGPVREGGQDGKCRRRAPTWYGFGKVLADEDWCGEYERDYDRHRESLGPLHFGEKIEAQA